MAKYFRMTIDAPLATEDEILPHVLGSNVEYGRSFPPRYIKTGYWPRVAVRPV